MNNGELMEASPNGTPGEWLYLWRGARVIPYLK